MENVKKQYWKIDFPQNEIYLKLVEKGQLLVPADYFFPSSMNLLIKGGVMSIRKGDIILSSSRRRSVSIYTVIDLPKLLNKPPIELAELLNNESCEGEYLFFTISAIKENISILDLNCEDLENHLMARYSIRNITRFADVIEKAITDKSTWTAEVILFEQLSKTDNLLDYIKKNKPVFYTNDPLIYLQKLKEEKGLTKAQIAKLSGQGNYVYKIFKGDKTPSRDVLICIGIGMGLTLDEIQKLLDYSKFALLTPKDYRDAIVIFGIFRNMNVEKINELLFEHKNETLF